MGYVYIIENIINKKKYIGQSQQLDIKSRWKYHKSCDKRYIGNILYNAYVKYGVNNFTFKIVCICFDEDTNKYEEEYITKYNTIYPNGYNLLKGGNNKKHNEYTKKKLSDMFKGTNHPQYGKQKSEEAIINQKNGLKIYYENKNKDKIKYITSNPHSEKTKQKIQLAILKHYDNNSKYWVCQYDMNKNLIKKYRSYTNAAKETGIGKTTISNACKNFEKMSRGYYWIVELK